MPAVNDAAAKNKAYESVYVIGETSETVVGTHTQIADLSSAVTLTPPGGAKFLTFQPLSQNVRMTFDGTTEPTSGIGFKFLVNGIYQVSLASGEVVKVIQESAGATLEYQWEG